MLILKMILIPMLVKVLLSTRRPLLCALLYAACLFTNGAIFDMAFGGDWGKIALNLLGATGLSYAFFYLLNEFDSSPFYWVTLILGSAALLVFF